MKFKTVISLALAISAMSFHEAAGSAVGVEQQPVKQNARTPSSPAAAPAKDAHSASETVVYSYEFSQPAFYYKHIVVEHDAAGRGTVTFEKQDGGGPITETLQLSQLALSRITGLWEALHFLDSDAVYQSEKQFPHLGNMKLRMVRGTKERLAEFNWTNDKSVSALVQEYRNATNQALFVFNITLSRQNQPLEAPKLMDQLDTMVTRNELADPADLVPLLQDLTTDERIPLMARNHAARILKKIKK
jgi:hypothetical protein